METVKNFFPSSSVELERPWKLPRFEKTRVQARSAMENTKISSLSVMTKMLPMASRLVHNMMFTLT